MVTIANINLDIAEKGNIQAVNVSQFDNNTKQFTVTIYKNGEAYTPDNSLNTIQCVGTKGDGHAFAVACTIAGNVVTVPVKSDMTAVAGKILSEITFFNSSEDILGTVNFLLIVEKGGITPDSDLSATEEDPYYIKTAVAEAVAAKEAAEDAAEEAESWSAHPPYIGDNGDWFVYDTTSETFVDSGVEARGPQGIQGIQGETGNGISSIEKYEETVDGVDTYRIYYTDGTYTVFQVKNGTDGATIMQEVNW